MSRFQKFELLLGLFMGCVFACFLALALPMLNFLTYLNMGLVVLLLPMLIMSQKLQKLFYQYHSMWFDMACVGIYAGIWGYGTGYMNTI